MSDDDTLTGLTMKYFVLKPAAKTHDDAYAQASQEAMFAYADSIRDHNPALAEQIRGWASQEAVRQARLS